MEEGSVLSLSRTGSREVDVPSRVGAEPEGPGEYKWNVKRLILLELSVSNKVNEKGVETMVRGKEVLRRSLKEETWRLGSHRRGHETHLWCEEAHGRPG